MRRCLLQTIDPSFDCDKPFVLPSGHYHHVRELLERSLDLRHTLINIMQINAHATTLSLHGRAGRIAELGLVPPARKIVQERERGDGDQD